MISKLLNSTWIASAILFLATAMASCSGNTTSLPEPEPETQTINVSLEGLASAEAHTLQFNAPGDWTASVVRGSHFLKISPTSGVKGDAEINIATLSDNFGISSREAEIQISVNGMGVVYSVIVEQQSAATDGIVISGHINEGLMTLESDATGTIFSDTITVKSDKPWTFASDGSADGVLSLQQMGTPGKDEEVKVIVSADYSKFATTAYNGGFYIKSNDGKAVPVKVAASASVSVFDHAQVQMNDVEKTSYEFTDAIQKGVFQADFYVDANVRWTVKNLPSWIVSAASTPTNVQNDGHIRKQRQHVTLRVNPDELSADGKTHTLELVDQRDQVVKSISLVFAGAGKNYINYSFSFPANDVNGNPWAFEAWKDSVEATGPVNRKRIEMEFVMTTAVDYSSIASAPFKLILVEGSNGIAKKKEVHWASLKMGSTSEQSRTTSGMYRKQLIIQANERNDADDKNGLTKPENARAAFVYIVPADVTFNDLWNGDRLKDEYADDLVLMTQKNDPAANYKFSFVGYENGFTDKVVNPAGESMKFDITPGSYTMVDFRIEKLNDGSTEWVKAADSECKLETTYDEHDNVKTITLVFGENVAKYNSMKKTWVGDDRTFRIVFSAFINDNAGSKEIYTVTFRQLMNKN